ncbi:IS66 family transposase [Kineobactrum salinum]|uniref:Transposase n=1 Tax=Kineobactrum salinum TaxID=2708301 RepID=A0A6C0U4G9_9GAMM|nr:transposase [Kineobactrum salinum]
MGCWARARRKFHELIGRSQSPIAEKALIYIGTLYDSEREANDLPARRETAVA